MATLENLPALLAPLAVVPITCAPVQLLYLKAGRRYDLGAVLYVATGTFAGGCLFNSGKGTGGAIREIFIVLAMIAAGFAVFRAVALAFSGAMSFTLISLAQLWATAPLINFLLRKQNLNGIYMTSVASGGFSLACAFVVGLLASVVISSTRLDLRMESATESPEMFSALMGSRIALALQTELLALATYFAAGILLRLVTNDLSPDQFGPEALWTVLAVSAAPRFRILWAVISPFFILLARFYIVTDAPPIYGVMLTYLLLSLCLGVSASLSLRRRIDRA